MHEELQVTVSGSGSRQGEDPLRVKHEGNYLNRGMKFHQDGMIDSVQGQRFALLIMEHLCKEQINRYELNNWFMMTLKQPVVPVWKYSEMKPLIR